MTEILMPRLSPTMEDGKLTQWRVKIGDRVAVGDVIAEIETDKATIEVEAVDKGIIAELLFPEGAEGIKIDTVIATFANGLPKSSETPVVSPLREELPTSLDIDRPTISPHATPSEPAVQAGRGLATPLAKRMAFLAKLDLNAIEGTGPNGRIGKRDIEAALGKAVARTAPTGLATPDQIALTLEQQGIAKGSYDLVPLDGMRRTVARRMSDSFRDVPHFPLTIDIEIDALLAARAGINAFLEADSVKVTINDLIIKAVALALRQVPEANASYTPGGVALHHSADIAIAVAVEGGLITPIVRGAESKGVHQIAGEIRALAARAREKKLRPNEFQGGTFSISNLGMFGIRSFTSILNPPQGCILSVGTGSPQPIVKADQVAIATVMSVTLTCDHRVVDGAIGARFLAALKTLLENPITMVL